MNDLSSYVISAILLATSVALVVRHVRVWKRLKAEELDEREYIFRYRQFRRRLQTSVMIGLMGVAIVVGQVLMDLGVSWRSKVWYWIGVLGLLLWILLLAVADAVATSAYYSRERSDLAVEHAKLQVELRNARERAGRRHNGKSDAGR
jgi:UDP-N-acetylmuramyl pentapeptide phosphotransferase/UDP-N-acetylglucosamine-1-phosphate transferase